MLTKHDKYPFHNKNPNKIICLQQSRETIISKLYYSRQVMEIDKENLLKNKKQYTYQTAPCQVENLIQIVVRFRVARLGDWK